MSPNCARSADIFGEMPNCETTVSRSMRQIRMWRAARGCAEPAVRLESSMEQPRKMMPENNPIQCRTPSECPTTVPAMWRDGRTPKAVGASTNERKMMPPIQTVRERNMRNRRMDIGRQFSVLSSQFSVLSSQFSVLSSQFSVLSSQFSVLSSQFSVLSSQLSVLSSQGLVRIDCCSASCFECLTLGSYHCEQVIE